MTNNSSTLPPDTNPTRSLKIGRTASPEMQRWQQIENDLDRMGSVRGRPVSGEQVTAFTRRYRDLCSDLSLAVTHQLSEPIKQYLHALVARGHARLYGISRIRSRSVVALRNSMLTTTPGTLIQERCLAVSAIVFFGSFLLSGIAAYLDAAYVDVMLGPSVMQSLEDMYSTPAGDRSFASNMTMSSFYIYNNVRIGLQCFAYGIFFGIGSIFCLLSNGLFLGAAFGFMLSGPCADNFLHFVTAHAPFELTGIVVAGAAGLKLGFSLVETNGYSRLTSLRRTAHESLPIIGLATFLIAFAAGIEAFWSPAPVDYGFKVAVFVACSAALVYYLFGLGMSGARPTTRSRDGVP